MRERSLRINSASRFCKSTSTLTLQVYNSCEVPAGCGGVVLRWIGKGEATPFEITYWTAGKSRLFIDENEYSETSTILKRLPLNHGDHVIAFEITGFNDQFAILMAAANQREGILVSSDEYSNPALLSLVDGTWKYCLDRPLNDLWRNLEYDDSGWFEMIHSKCSTEAEGSYHSAIDLMTKMGAIALGIESKKKSLMKLFKKGGTSGIWIRKKFSTSLERQ